MPRDLAALWAALATSRVGRELQSFFAAAVDIWTALPPRFQGTELRVFAPAANNVDGLMCLGPHCQCAALAETWGAQPDAS
eukprot:2053400-Lingulodinium_polyedra.AAC.1